MYKDKDNAYLKASMVIMVSVSPVIETTYMYKDKDNAYLKASMVIMVSVSPVIETTIPM